MWISLANCLCFTSFTQTFEKTRPLSFEVWNNDGGHEWWHNVGSLRLVVMWPRSTLDYLVSSLMVMIESVLKGFIIVIDSWVGQSEIWRFSNLPYYLLILLEFESLVCIFSQIRSKVRLLFYKYISWNNVLAFLQPHS